MRFIARAAGVGMDPPADREERVRSILEVKEHIAKKIEGHEAEIEMLRRNLELLDSALTKSSFSKASDLLRASGAGRAAGGGGGDAAAGTAAGTAAGGGGDAAAGTAAGGGGDAAAGTAAGGGGGGGGGGDAAAGTAAAPEAGRAAGTRGGKGGGSGGPEPIEIRSAAEGGRVLARAYVTDDSVSVVVADGVEIDPNAAEIQEAIIDKLVGRMRREDAAEKSPAQAEADVEADGGRLLSLTVRNYRKQGRVGEIVGMARWAVNQLVAAGR